MRADRSENPSRAAGLRRLTALMIKETRQTVRDPSSILIASVLPLTLLFLFGYGVSLDAKHVGLGVAVESDSPEAREMLSSFMATDSFSVVTARDHRILIPQLVAGKLRGIVVIPQDFAKKVQAGDPSPIQIITDGSETNTAAFVRNYARGVLEAWKTQHGYLSGSRAATETGGSPGAQLLTRIWYNPELDSRNSLVPGSLTIIMAIIGTLLTSLVVAREWERGTMEALLATPLRPIEILVSKTLPYFGLGLLSLLASTGIAVLLFRVPFRGSLLALVLTGGVFLLAALSQGLMISTMAKNQFIASQMALITGFLPSFLLSGFIFEISSMPLPLQWLTRIVPARYLVTSLQSIFLVGDVWALFWPMLGYLSALSALFLTITFLKTPRRVG